ncbi:UvrD-helicase domain-containing protein [Deinococcus radiophilus]|uniref:ATP-dependent helicase n=1 Tax=Deinococcus radiophilus TaxID=32062 RepID=A0A3S0K995_9DEIO|nr:UvrD-helicase domain-containing protein [Deinococcus radiophilus]RTR25509.1 ATP-dependent helicase [Deinococcus radiophilus]UFA51724.1 AAA family ATPase [Deinococcus radiophilus]
MHVKPLTHEQREIVTAQRVPLTVVRAGAGTGKTRVLVDRLDHLLQQDPAVKVAVVPFGRKVALEITDRLHRTGVHAGSPQILVKTLHALSYRHLRERLDAVKRAAEEAGLLRFDESVLGEPAYYIDDAYQGPPIYHDVRAVGEAELLSDKRVARRLYELARKFGYPLRSESGELRGVLAWIAYLANTLPSQVDTPQYALYRQVVEEYIRTVDLLNENRPQDQISPLLTEPPTWPTSGKPGSTLRRTVPTCSPAPRC